MNAFLFTVSPVPFNFDLEQFFRHMIIQNLILILSIHQVTYGCYVIQNHPV